MYIHHCKVSYIKGDLSPTLVPWKPEIICKNETFGRFLVVLKTFETRVLKNLVKYIVIDLTYASLEAESFS